MYDDPVKRNFFTIPAVRVTEGDTTKQIIKDEYYGLHVSIKKDFEPSKYSKVCLDHFTSGMVALLYLNSHQRPAHMVLLCRPIKLMSRKF